MKISIVGAGMVGRALGAGFAKAGHTVSFAVRDPAAYRPGATPQIAATPLSAAGASDVIVLAVPWTSVVSALAALGPLDGKILVDVTNPVAPPYEDIAVGTGDSGAETISRRAPKAHVVKAFNTCGAETMANPRFAEGPAVMPVAGDDARAKRTVLELAQALGFDAVDAGGLATARLMEPMALLWIKLAYTQGLGRNFAFRLARR
jgi:8-hydroxy-5-deazaflavin:NADPH oxidoreductase